MQLFKIISIDIYIIWLHKASFILKRNQFATKWNIQNIISDDTIYHMFVCNASIVSIGKFYLEIHWSPYSINCLVRNHVCGSKCVFTIYWIITARIPCEVFQCEIFAVYTDICSIYDKTLGRELLFRM